ncbi:hypothetical protein [Macrococcoides caseolyticum]|uniref:hypothetical protein n=1 Tax=Macrococcoides caseolyticum TaxID=69966 RepID=UPI002A24688A|nr:hypothetical protein [Macrococcus caseolyticus]
MKTKFACKWAVPGIRLMFAFIPISFLSRNFDPSNFPKMSPREKTPSWAHFVKCT